MYTYIFCATLAILFSFINEGKKEINLLFSFAILFLFMAFRYEYGNDYTGYGEMFQLINSKSVVHEKIEFLWVKLNLLFSFANFQLLIVFISLLVCRVYYILIKNNVSHQLYWFALFIFLFNSNIFLLELSALRQTIAVIVFLYSIKYLVNKKYLYYMLGIGIASLFHQSAILLLLLLLIVPLLIKIWNKRLTIVIIVLYGCLSLLAPLFKERLGDLSEIIFGLQYAYVSEEELVFSRVNMIIYGILIVFLSQYINTINNMKREYMVITIIGFVILPVSFILPMFSRMLLYFAPVSIISYPAVLPLIKSKFVKRIFLFSVIGILLLRIVIFFYSSTYHDYYFDYKTIFNLYI